MSKIYKPCPYCMNEIMKKPILEKQQGLYSILCPYCLSHRCEWVSTIEEAITSWNEYMREETDNYGVFSKNTIVNNIGSHSYFNVPNKINI